MTPFLHNQINLFLDKVSSVNQYPFRHLLQTSQLHIILTLDKNLTYTSLNNKYLT